MNVDIREYLRVATNFIIVVKFSFLKSDETEDGEITSYVLDGNLNITKNNGLRRSFTMRVENTDGYFLLQPQSFWINKKFKLELGYEINGAEHYFPQGIFVMSKIDLNDVGSDNSVSIEASDKFSLLNGDLGGEISAAYRVNSGDTIEGAIRAILIEVNDPKLPVLHISNEDTTPYTMNGFVGDTYGSLLLSLNDMLMYNMYYDIEGRLRVEPDIPDIYKDVVWNYTTDEPHYQGGTLSYPIRDVYNAVVIVGASVNGETAKGYSENNAPDSYYSIARLGRTRVYVVEDDNIATDTQAQERSDYEKKKKTQKVSTLNFQSIPLFFVDVDKIITFTSEKLKLDSERFLINSLSIPLKASGGDMTVDASAASTLDFV